MPTPPSEADPSSARADASASAPRAARGPSILRDPSFVVALLIALVVAMGFGLVIPVLPLFARSFGVGLFAVTLVVSVFAGVRLVSNVYAGVLADRTGTARAVATGAVIVGVSSLASALSPGYWWLVAFRGIGGFGSALFFTALLALVVRIVPADQRGRSMGMLQGAFLLGIALGPGVGGLLAGVLGLRLPFVIYAVFCMIAAAVAAVLLPRAERRAGRAPAPDHAAVMETAEGEPAAAATEGRARGTWAAARDLSRDRAFVAALVMMAASRWAATGVRFSLIPVFAAEVVGASEAVLGFGLTLAALTHFLILWPAGKVADSVGRKTIGAPAYFAFAVASVVLAFAATPTMFLVLLAVYGLATGLTSITPPAIVADVVPPERSGVAVGVLNTAGDLGSVLGPLVSGWLAQQYGYLVGFGASGVLLAVGGVFALLMRETLPSAEAVAAPEPATTR